MRPFWRLWRDILLVAACLLWENTAPAALHTVGGDTMAPIKGAYIFLRFCHPAALLPATLHIADYHKISTRQTVGALHAAPLLSVGC